MAFVVVPRGLRAYASRAPGTCSVSISSGSWVSSRVTTDYDTMQFAGHGSGAMLLGVFQVSILHNVVHLAFGVAGLALARSWSGARAYLIGGGLVYGLLWLHGLIVDKDHQANFVPLNNADDCLHLVLAIGMIGLGVALSRTGAPHRTGR